MCAYGRPIVEYDCDEEPDPAIVGTSFHQEWLRESATFNALDTLTLRRRETRRLGMRVAENGDSGRGNAQSEQLVGLMGSDFVSSY